MSPALRQAFAVYCAKAVGGYAGGDERMNTHQFNKLCQDAGIMEPHGGQGMAGGGGRCPVRGMIFASIREPKSMR